MGLKKYIFWVFIFLSNLSSSQTLQDAFIKANTLLQELVDENGNVDYATAKEKIAEFESYQTIVAQLDIANLKQSEIISLMINTYNLKVIEAIAKKYPINSVNEVPNFFDKPVLSWDGKKLSLNEYETALRKIADARIHFALVCGAVSCPQLKNLAFGAKNIEDELFEVTQNAFNNPNVLVYEEVKRVAKISQIFKWYEEDFTKTGTIGEYLNNFQPKVNPNSTIEYLNYDWSLNDQSNLVEHGFNLQAQAPSRNFNSGTLEVKSFWNLYTQTKGYDANGSKVNYGNRSSYLTGLTSIIYGLNEKLNLGTEFWLSSVNIGNTSSSVFLPYQFKNNAAARAALSYVGPKLRWQPFEKAKGFTIQSTFLIPTGNDLDGDENGGVFLTYDRFLWINQFMADKQIGSKWQVFGQVSTWTSFFAKSSSFSNFMETPVTGFLSYFPTTRITLYLQQEFWPRWGANGLAAYFRQEGFGFKYQLIPQTLEFESSATFFTAGKNQGAGNTLNFGLRWVR